GDPAGSGAADDHLQDGFAHGPTSISCNFNHLTGDQANTKTSTNAAVAAISPNPRALGDTLRPRIRPQYGRARARRVMMTKKPTSHHRPKGSGMSRHAAAARACQATDATTQET